MGEKQKNQAMVNAFGTGKPPVATVRRRGETRQQQRARGQGIDPNSDISAIFGGMQQLRTKVHKGLSGMPLNPDGTDPGNSFDRFMRQNPHLQGAAQRQAQYDQQAKNNLQANLQSAIVERKALQEMQNQNPNLVKGADGYMTLFDGQGKVIGTTKPLQSKAAWSEDNAINRGTASSKERQDFANTLQNAGMSSVASKIQGPKLPANMSTLFPGKRQPGIQYGPRQPVQQSGWDMLFPGQKAAEVSMEPNSSPPGGGQGDRVGSSNPSGEPGGETSMGQMPNVQGEGMPMGVPKVRTVADPQLPALNSEQLAALKALDARGFPARVAQETPQAPSRFRMGLTNYFPGNDYDYLQQLFPGQSIDQILQLFPAYANQFR